MMQESCSKEIFYVILQDLLSVIENETCVVPYSGLIIAGHSFKEEYKIKCKNVDLLVTAIMRLLIKYGYTGIYDYGKFTITYVLRKKSSEIPFTISEALTFRKNGEDIPIYSQVVKIVNQKANEYGNELISSLNIRIYHSEKKGNNRIISDDEIANKLWECMSCQKMPVEPEKALSLGKGQARYPKYITALKPSEKAREDFIVADTETVLVNDIHVPYAMGFLVVRAGDNLSSDAIKGIETFFSEDHPVIVFPTFEKRSRKILFDFIERLVVVVRNKPSIKTVYFHNFSRFDGIILLQYLATHAVKYRVKPLMRNNQLYEIAVYSGKKRLFCIRDSLLLLPGKLDSLAKTLCPHLGSKGSIPHDEISVESLIPLRKQLLNYMKQDIILLGGVMLKAQDIYWSCYNVDIVKKLTLSSLALTIFRTNYYDQKHWPIHIPNRNEDTFIRRGYYGGHSETYIPKGENLSFYDVTSLYPFIMKSCPMPGGKPVWRGHLEDQDLDSLYGFIEAYVECPTDIKRPFLPYRDKINQTLVFPTGEFVGVYYSEELKYARQIGYKVLPLQGYLFDQKNSNPFESFVSSLFERRQDAKKAGDEAMSYVYKILMNSLYGRFGINPKSTTTEICDQNQYNEFLISPHKRFIFANKLSDQNYLLHYKINTDETPETEWRPPTISAVQLAAAITACARIHMYPYISRPDCYYTDTDSVVLGSPLPDEEISSVELGKFKLENVAMIGYFLAPKTYHLITTKGDKITKHKGPAKDFVDDEWFESQYADIKRTKIVQASSNFRIDREKLNIIKKNFQLTLGLSESKKRKVVFDNNNNWVDTLPLVVKDYTGHERRILEYKSELHNKEKSQYIKTIEEKDKIISDLESKLGNFTSEDQEET